MKKPDLLYLKCADGSSIEVTKASTFGLRLRGLLGRKTLPDKEGLLLEPCSAVHMIGMQFTIDIVFLSKTNQVLAVYAHVPPGWRGYSLPRAHRVLELAAGAAEKIPCVPGDVLAFAPK